eukprot:6334405-Amphidinium_carterae.1
MSMWMNCSSRTVRMMSQHMLTTPWEDHGGSVTLTMLYNSCQGARPCWLWVNTELVWIDVVDDVEGRVCGCTCIGWRHVVRCRPTSCRSCFFSSVMGPS